MSTRALATVMLVSLTLAGCFDRDAILRRIEQQRAAELARAEPDWIPIELRATRIADQKDDARPIDVQRRGGGMTGFSKKKGYVRFLKNRSEVATVESTKLPERVWLGAGTYEVEWEFDDGPTVVIDELTIFRARCFAEKPERGPVGPGKEALLLARHMGTRVIEGTHLSVPRVVADYGVQLKTRATWIHEGEPRHETTHLGDAREVKPVEIRDDRPEYRLERQLEGGHDLTTCNTLWRLHAGQFRIPDDVLRAGGKWTLRLVSNEAQTIEVDFDLSASARDRRFGPKKNVSMLLDRRVVHETEEERGWQLAREAESRMEGENLGQWGLGPAIPITPAMYRAAYRTPKFQRPFLDFVFSRRAASFGTVNRSASYASGISRGESLGQIEGAINQHQAQLDADSSYENAARRADLRRLRPVLEKMIKAEGGRFSPSEFPSPW